MASGKKERQGVSNPKIHWFDSIIRMTHFQWKDIYPVPIRNSDKPWSLRNKPVYRNELRYNMKDTKVQSMV